MVKNSTFFEIFGPPCGNPLAKRDGSMPECAQVCALRTRPHLTTLIEENRNGRRLSCSRRNPQKSLTGFYRVGQKLSDVISVLQITPRATEPSTVSVFFSVVRCCRVCRAQTCAHSGIEPSRLAKRFPRGGQKSSKKFEFLTISTIYVIKYLRNDYK